MLVGGIQEYRGSHILRGQFEIPYLPNESYVDAYDQITMGGILVNVGMFLALVGIGIGFVGIAIGPVPQPAIAYGQPQQPPQYPPQEPPPPP